MKGLKTKTVSGYQLLFAAGTPEDALLVLRMQGGALHDLHTPGQTDVTFPKPQITNAFSQTDLPGFRLGRAW